MTTAACGLATTRLSQKVEQFMFFPLTVDMKLIFLTCSCFIQYHTYGTKLTDDRNINFFFEKNTAKSGVGNMIFAESLLPCTHNQPPEKLFEDVGNVHHTGMYDIASPAIKFSFSSTGLDKVIPGRETIMNISAFDELDHKQDVVYEAFMNSSNNITIDPAYFQVSNNAIKFHGNSFGSVGLLRLETESASLSISIHLSECPPGFLNDGESCVCLFSSLKE